MQRGKGTVLVPVFTGSQERENCQVLLTWANLAVIFIWGDFELAESQLILSCPNMDCKLGNELVEIRI